jgi:hypothetical protein
MGFRSAKDKLWLDGSTLNLQTQFKSDTISASYQGKRYDISFEYRDPWDWITRLLEDDTLGPHMIFNSVRKYYCEGTEQETHCERIIDEPNTGDTWNEYEVSSHLSCHDVALTCLRLV